MRVSTTLVITLVACVLSVHADTRESKRPGTAVPAAPPLLAENIPQAPVPDAVPLPRKRPTRFLKRQLGVRTEPLWSRNEDDKALEAASEDLSESGYKYTCEENGGDPNQEGGYCHDECPSSGTYTPIFGLCKNKWQVCCVQSESTCIGHCKTNYYECEGEQNYGLCPGRPYITCCSGGSIGKDMREYTSGGSSTVHSTMNGKVLVRGEVEDATGYADTSGKDTAWEKVEEVGEDGKKRIKWKLVKVDKSKVKVATEEDKENIAAAEEARREQEEAAQAAEKDNETGDSVPTPPPNAPPAPFTIDSLPSHRTSKRPVDYRRVVEKKPVLGRDGKPKLDTEGNPIMKEVSVWRKVEEEDGDGTAADNDDGAETQGDDGGEAP